MKATLLVTLSASILYTTVLTRWAPDKQPDVHPPPTLSAVFSLEASRWKEMTPLLRGSEKSGPLDKGAATGRRASSTTGSWNGWQGIRYIFSFGDSYTSTGFNISDSQPDPGNPLGNPNFPGATSSNGPNYISFLTATYNQSYIETYNFGFGGAVIDQSIVPSPFGTGVETFKDQVSQEFQPKYTGSAIVPWESTNSLFIVFFGINDAINTYSKANNDSLQYADIKSYENLVNQVYLAGARNFLFLNVPPIDRAPYALNLNGPAVSGLAKWIGDFNFRLGALVWNLTNRYPDVTAFQFNTESLFTQVLNDPSRFPETAMYHNTTSYCLAYDGGISTMDYFIPSCGVPVNQYFWLNTIHPTYPMHNFLASQVSQLLQS